MLHGFSFNSNATALRLGEFLQVFFPVFLTFPNPVRKFLWKYHIIKIGFLFSSLVWGLLPTHCRCRWLFLHLVTFNDAYTLDKTPLDERSARRRDLYLHNTQHSQQTDIYAPGGIRTRNFSKQEAADPHIRPRGHRYRRKWNSLADYLPIIKRYHRNIKHESSEKRNWLERECNRGLRRHNSCLQSGVTNRKSW